MKIMSPDSAHSGAVRTGQPAWLWITPALWYVVLPIADWLVGRDSRNPPDSAVPSLEADGYYKFLVYASIPLFYVSWLIAAWAIATQDYDWVGYLGVSLAVALTNGLALVVGHEIGHKSSRLEKRLAQIVLAVPAYGHFSAEHNRGHHKDVATPNDPASSRFGESLYAFVLREIPGALSFLLHGDPTAVVQGVDAVPPNERPPLAIVHLAPLLWELFKSKAGIP